MTPEPKWKTQEERWALGTSLDPDEQRYVLERFPESRRTLRLTETEWLAQTSFRLNRSGTLDLRAITCRLPLVAGEEPRFHRVPRGKEWPTPAPPKRQHGQREPQRLPDGVRPIVEGALATGDLATANEALRRLSGGKTARQVAEGWAAKIQAPPAEPRPSLSDEGHSYTQRVYQAYRDLAKEYRSPDVRIDALHSRLGGNLQDLHRWLRQACRDHLAVPSTGEPTLADHAARQSALCLPGETDRATGKPQSFLLIKLIDALPMTQEQQPQQTAAPTQPVRGISRNDLDVIIEALEYRCDAIEGGTDFDEVARLKAIVPTLEKLRAIEAQPLRPEHEQHPTITLTLTAGQADLVAEALHYGAYELAQYADGHGREEDGVETHCDYLGDLEKGLMAFVENPKERAGELRMDQPAEIPAQAKYEKLLRETAALRYPYPERTPELEARIEKTIARKVGEFTQERQAKQYEASLRKTVAERHPNLTLEQAQRYEQRIAKLVEEFRQNQAQQQAQTPARARGQEQGIER